MLNRYNTYATFTLTYLAWFCVNGDQHDFYKTKMIKRQQLKVHINTTTYTNTYPVNCKIYLIHLNKYVFTVQISTWSRISFLLCILWKNRIYTLWKADYKTPLLWHTEFVKYDNSDFHSNKLPELGDILCLLIVPNLQIKLQYVWSHPYYTDVLKTIQNSISLQSHCAMKKQNSIYIYTFMFLQY